MKASVSLCCTQKMTDVSTLTRSARYLFSCDGKCHDFFTFSSHTEYVKRESIVLLVLLHENRCTPLSYVTFGILFFQGLYRVKKNI